MKAFVFLIISACVFFTGCTSLSFVSAGSFFGPGPQYEFLKASGYGDTKEMERQLRRGADINRQGREGMTALIWALWQGNKRSYEWLLQHGADPNLQMPATDLARYGFFSGASAVSVAARHRDPWFLEITLKYGGNPNLYNPIMKETVIFDCISFYEKKHDGIAQLELLIKYGADLNAAHPSTPMMYAAIFNRYDMVYMMLEAGADPTIVISGKFSLLTDLKRDMTIPGDSLSQWRKEVIKLLREKGVTFDGDE